MSDAPHPMDRYLPHRGAMRLVERLVAHDAESVVVETCVPSDGLFVDEDGTPAWVGVEYMAQAIAAWAGANARDRGEAPKLGFLLGTRRYTCTVGHFPHGTLLRIEARREILGDNGLAVFACRILSGESELAAALVSVYEPADAHAFLQGGTP